MGGTQSACCLFLLPVWYRKQMNPEDRHTSPLAQLCLIPTLLPTARVCNVGSYKGVSMLQLPYAADDHIQFLLHRQ